METVTILTPTYNRGHLLPKLYDSLCAQTNKDFCWMIVDDGSTDDTPRLIKKIAATAPFRVIDISKKNGGKHTAVNLGVKKIETPLTFIVDSDDRLTCKAVSLICSCHQKYKNNKTISGYCFLKGSAEGSILDGRFAEKESIGNYIDDRLNKNMWGDKAEVYYTHILQKFPFPEYQGEKFISEDIVWIQIALKYNIVQVDQQIYICDYLEDGLTKNGRKMKMSSPRGGKARAELLMAPRCSKRLRLKGALLYSVYSRILGEPFKMVVKSSPCKVLSVFTYPIALYLKNRWEKEVGL